MAPALFGQFSIGAAAGGNIAFWKLDIPLVPAQIKGDPLLNYQVMLPLSYSISKYCQVRAEFGYHRRAWGKFTLTGDSGADLGKSYLVYQYLEGGLLATFQPLRRARPIYFLGGVSMSRLTPSSILHLSKGAAQNLGVERVAKQSNDFDNEHRTQWLWNLGVGISKTIGPGKVFVEWRVQRNMANILTVNTSRKDFTAVAMNVGYQYSL